MLKILKPALLICLATGLSACGQDQTSWIKNAEFKKYSQNGDLYGELISYLDTENVSIMPVELPILDPKDPSRNLGHVAVRSGINAQKVEVAIALNFTQVVDIPDTIYDPTLPNGTHVPIASNDLEGLITFPLKDSGSKVFLKLAKDQVIMGTALVVKDMSVSAPANIFFPFTYEKVSGLGGLFFGPNESQSGFAVFSDVTHLLSFDWGTSGFQSAHLSNETSTQKVHFIPQAPSNAIYNQIMLYLYKLNKNKAKLYIDSY